MIEFGNSSHEVIQSILNSLRSNHEIGYASPILLNDTGKEFGTFTNQIIVRLKSTSDLSGLTTLLERHKVHIEKQYEYDSKTYFLTLEDEATKNAMEIANEFHNSGLFQYAEPNFLLFVEMNTEDEHYGNQWALNNVNDHDMDVVEAWDLTTGCNDIRTAILDIGVELDHPDLANNLLQGFDATGGNSGGAPINNTGDMAHGTACAGIVAAEGNNEIGIVGVAYNSLIIPVRIATRSANWTITESGFVASGIDLARLNGADVINMSFSVQQTNNIETAIDDAVTTGRNGLGCILIAASGNSNTTISYPANNANVIAVGATTNQDSRASFSNFGTGLDVVAPGVDIFVTDAQGNIGYNASNGTNGDYFSGFTGTSAAAPQVAGIAALILSVNPTLTFQEVRDIIESTTDKVGGVAYTLGAGEQAGLTWNNQMGYGRVNAFNAVQAALLPISGPDLLCSTNTFTLADVPATSTATWSVTPSRLFSGSTSGTGFNAILSPYHTNASGQATITFSVEGPCGTYNILKSFWVGRPAVPGPITGDASPGPGSLTPYYVNSLPAGATSMSWGLPYCVGCSQPWSIYTGHNSILISANVGDSDGYVQAMGANACGTGGASFLYVTVSGPCDPCPRMYPNPVSDRLTVEWMGLDGRVSDEEVGYYKVSLYNQVGEYIVSDSGNRPRLQLDVSQLRNGFYYLHIENEDGLIRKLVRIER